MTVGDKKAAESSPQKYDCTTCPYPRYKDKYTIFCDVCIRKILDEQNRKKQRKDEAVDCKSLQKSKNVLRV